jgi:copper chaperone CopZ
MKAPAKDVAAAASATVSLPIEGMTCASCVARVERALKAVPGVASAAVNLATERATVTGTADIGLLTRAVADAGYAARTISRAAGDADATARKEA